jgi:hypothetical protein
MIHTHTHTHTQKNHTMEYYSPIKKYGIMLFAGKWTELEDFR